MSIPLPQLPLALRKRTGKPVSYASCYRAVVDGVIPAGKVGRGWFIEEKDMPAIAVALGLVAPEAKRAAQTV